jgi:hypothetical protein
MESSVFVVTRENFEPMVTAVDVRMVSSIYLAV